MIVICTDNKIVIFSNFKIILAKSQMDQHQMVVSKKYSTFAKIGRNVTEYEKVTNYGQIE